jgi:glycosyltransferase involved in cell wall biosynthesis
MNISVLVPCYNESARILQLVELLHNLKLILEKNDICLEFLLVNNGCTDDTFEKFSSLESKHANCCQIQILRVDENIGYGFGVKTALHQTLGKKVCILPADGKYELLDIYSLLSMYATSRNEGLLLKGLRFDRNDPKLIQLLSFFYSKLVNLLTGIRVKDVNGLPKVFKNSFVAAEIDLLSNTACLDATLLYLWSRKGGSFQERAITFTQNNDGKASWSGKRTITAIKMFRELVMSSRRIRFNL